MGPRGSASSVFTDFAPTAWSSTGVVFLAALVGPVGYLTGADSSVHLGEEVRNSSWVLPRAMITTAISNYVLSFLAVVTLLFTVGSVEEASNSPTGQPYLAILLNATNSRGATMTLAIVMLILVVSCAVNGCTTVSRQVWYVPHPPYAALSCAHAYNATRSFARDGGPPFANWLGQVRPGWDL